VSVLAILALGFTVVFSRLVWLQVQRASALEGMAIDQRSRTIDIAARRGAILDRDGLQLAMSVPAQGVFADPGLVQDASSEATTVAAALHLPRDQVYAELTERVRDGHQNRFAWIEHGVRLDVAHRLQEQHLPGIGFIPESRRDYPAGSLASQVLGFVNTDGAGIAGLESQYQTQLAGRSGTEIVQQDRGGTMIPQAGVGGTPAVAGSDVVLTIDRAIQYRAQQALAAAVKANKGSGGSIVALDPRTGQVLAMASYPWFNPNDRGAYPASTYPNRSVTDTYEPGSVNKVITASAALQDGLIDLHRRLTVPDAYQVADYLFHDAEVHPTELMTLADILAYSSNIGTIRIAEILGKDRLAAYLYRFGLGAVTGVGFPQEAAGILPPVDQWSGTSIGSIPIGQGIAVTPLQMACVYATIANGGVWVQPSLVRGFVGPNGTYQAAPAPLTREVISPTVASEVTQMLAYAVDVGTGTEAQIPGFWVAGKTGTARIPLPQGGYSTGTYHASFIGFAPASRPAVVVAAVINDTANFGGAAAAPLFQEVARFALARLRVPPAPRLPEPDHALPAG
jgi:cell division protein FtsI (penicillin-binding protein 3)